MRKSAIILLLFIITILNGCSNVHEANFEDFEQPLTKAQVDEIITTATESIIVDVDFSQISKPDPVQQTEINERMRCLGKKLKGKVTIENKNIIVARVNEETITASDWYWEKINKIIQAEYNNMSIPSSAEILNDLIETKVISSTARNLGIYPPEEQIKAYIADQQRYMGIEEITILIQAWGISEEDYFLLMEDRFADSLAKINWGVYLEKYKDEAHEDEQGYVAKNPSRIGDARTKPLLDKAKVEITSEGRKLGIED